MGFNKMCNNTKLASLPFLMGVSLAFLILIKLFYGKKEKS